MSDDQALPLCPYCGHPSLFLDDSSTLYGGKNYGPAYACRPCHAWVGCHPGTTTPLGRLANKALRRARNRAHAAFDPIWKEGLMKRGDAYAWLADQLGIERKDCHIEMFDNAQCERVVCVADWWRERSSARTGHASRSPNRADAPSPRLLPGLGRAAREGDSSG